MTGGIRGSRRSHAFLHQVTQSLSRLSLLVEPSLFPLLFLFDFRGSHLGFCKFRRRKKRRSWAWALSPPLFFLRCQGSEGRRFLRPSLGSLFSKRLIIFFWFEMNVLAIVQQPVGAKKKRALCCVAPGYIFTGISFVAQEIVQEKKTLSKKI